MELGRPKKRRKQRKRKHQRKKPKASATAEAAATVGAPQLPAEIWCSTYKSLLAWHQAQVRSVCGRRMEQAEAESWSEKEDDEEDEEVEDEELEEQQLFAVPDEVEEVDEEYLKFLEITLQHQEELKRTRAAAAAAAAAAET
ncbi:uncharacterized protein Dmoj_GI21820 [Drosophila mojavensis]|uniref:Uncharacterized protein n=1 Tax=Drosophila mojavensis TaxID=7230 RepID=B4KFG0_DROMO|nr:uncharacterized protein Dmoj_GI21820 [Drosophila mojavensis]